MLKSYLKIGLRNLLRNRSLFIINVTGLGLGIATCLVIMLFVADELSFDRYNDNADQIVRVVLRGQVNGEIIKEAVTPAPVGATLKNDLPEVIDATRIRNIGKQKISYQNKTFRDSKVAFVDPNFFDVFTIQFIKGDPKSALKDPNSIVITRTKAEQYFGKDDPINKVLEFNDSKEQYRVTGIIEDIPANSHFHFDGLASMTGHADARNDSWMASNYYTYVVLSKGTDITQLEGKLPAIVEKYMGPQISQIGMTFEKFKANGNQIGLYVQKLTDIHLHPEFAGNSEIEAGGNLMSVYIFAAVAIFMLAIACINFMNLATASATKRNKEIGVKKVLGSQRKQLIQQFLMEAAISTTVAMTMAMVLVKASLPLFNELSGKTLHLEFLSSPLVLAGLLVLAITITLLAGGYPAFYLSSIKPISALKNKLIQTGRGKGIRSGLVVFQFVISAGLILAILIVNQQMHFIQNKEVGYTRDRLLVLRESWLLGKNENAFLNDLRNDPRIERVTQSAFVPAGPTDMNMTGVYPGSEHEATRRTILFKVDDQYIPTMGMTLISGRNFSAVPAQDSLNVIVNETAIKIFGLGKQPLGEKLTVNTNGGTKVFTVTGVVKDFHFRSLHEPIAPLPTTNQPYGGLIIRTKSAEISQLVADIESKWKKFHVEEPFTYAVLDESYNETYIAEQKMGSILQIFGMITIFVACLGLFGLITFTAEQRVKEIGIRKVLGANVGQIVSLLSRDLLWLVGVSFIIAFPLGYYLMNHWLQDFAYRIDIEWWVYLVAGVTTLVIAFATMSFTTLRSATANPVDSLKME